MSVVYGRSSISYGNFFPVDLIAIFFEQLYFHRLGCRLMKTFLCHGLGCCLMRYFDSIDLGVVLWNVCFHRLGYRLMKYFVSIDLGVVL